MIGNIITGVAVLLFFAAWAALCTAKYRKWQRRRRNCTLELPVRVVDVLERKTARGSMVYKPIFEPVDPADSTVIDSAYYSNLVSFEVGEAVNLLVNPDNTKEFLYKDDSLNKGRIVDIVCCCLPIICVIGYILVIAYR